MATDGPHSLLPIDADLGPFPGRPYLDLWWRHFGQGSLVPVSEDDGGALLWSDPDGLVRFAGDSYLTDYHSPRGSGGGRAIASYLAACPAGTGFVLDSLTTAAADVVGSALAEREIGHSKRQHEIAARLTLPASFDDYLGSLTKKERHEVRRKHRRLTEAHGPLEVTSGGGRDFDDFVTLHRGAAGAKGRFMDDAHVEFFRDLGQIGGVAEVLRSSAGDPLAAVFGFFEDDVYYLYNSAYDVGQTSLSPGIVHLTALIRSLIGAGSRMLDFLKGDEGYKLRLGAQPRPLYELKGET